MFVWHYNIFLLNTNSVKKINNTVRIIGGHYRGKKIDFPNAPGLRPTSDRIRETLFNWLMHDIRGARCLDAFAGSGALGLEAYSRGAAQVRFLETNPLIYQHLQNVIAGFQSPNLSITQCSALTYLANQQPTHTTQFDIVFLDPPFAHLDLFECIRYLETSSLLVAGGLIYVESPHDLSLDPQFWQQIKLKTAGNVVYGLYVKREFG